MQNEIYFDNDQEDMPRTIRRRKKQLYESIRERMEFYFSDANLQKDRFLSKLISEDPQIDLSTFLTFNKIRQLTTSLHDLKKALKKSEFLELTEDKTKVFRKTPIKEKTNVDACTIYVEQLSCEVDHEWIKQIFSRYGKVDYVSIPKYKNTGKIKGFAFVEFETPEAAKAALDEFEREGCCLTNQMNPEKLCSISTFEDDKFDVKNQINNQQTSDKVVKSQPVKLVENENESRKATKRKLKENEDEVVQEEKKSRKADVEESDNKNGIEVKKDKSQEETKPNVTDSESQDESKNPVETEIPTKKKKNRKKKKSLKPKYVNDIKMYGLQILSKADWKKLRNKYLNIQKEKMKKLKQHLYKSHMNQAFKQQQVTNQVHEPSSKPRFTFSKGCIVKVVFDEPLKESTQVNQFKCDAKRLHKVEYIDVEIGNKEGYIRFLDADTVQETIQSKPWENMFVLEGEEEEQYWEKMRRDRCEKLENKSKFKKKRGRKKIIDKTEKLMSKKIRLSVDE